MGGSRHVFLKEFDRKVLVCGIGNSPNLELIK